MATPDTLPATKAIKRRDIVASARSWVGVPYRHLGRDRSGVDCAGLIMNVAKDFAIVPEAPAAYSNQPKGQTLLVPADKQMWKITRDRIIPGDIVVLWAWTPSEPQHFGVIGDSPHGVTLIHAFSKFKAVTEQSWNRFWNEHFHGIYNLPGTEEAFV
jgi:cell wall-associated NlpC family hydrolase